MSIFGRLMCTYCLLKDVFVSGFYVTEVSDYIEKSGLFFFFQKANKNGSDDFNLEVTEK